MILIFEAFLLELRRTHDTVAVTGSIVVCASTGSGSNLVQENNKTKTSDFNSSGVSGPTVYPDTIDDVFRTGRCPCCTERLPPQTVKLTCGQCKTHIELVLK